MTYLFYDVETSGISPAYQRVMQFAGQRTDTDLQPIGEPINILVKLPEDVLPEPEAILVHGITPQKTLEEGISEKELADRLMSEVFTPETVAIGFNNIRFDDDFIRNVFWRSFYDPYEWHWKSNRSRWDLLDASRLMRALRPSGLKWSFDAEGKPVNRLGALAEANDIDTSQAHDALADVNTTIELARRIRNAQPKLFDYLIKLRDKKTVEQLISSGEPFVYTSGRYGGEYLKTTVAVKLGPHPKEDGSVLVYDLRFDPSPFAGLNPKELAKLIYVPYQQRDKIAQLPVKKLAFNRAPAVAPLKVLDRPSMVRIKLIPEVFETNLQTLKQTEGFVERVTKAFGEQHPPQRLDPDGQLYDGFLNDKDCAVVAEVRRAKTSSLTDFKPDFIDKRLQTLFLRYKARNFPETLSDQERGVWEGWREAKLIKGVDNSLTFSSFGQRLQRLAANPRIDDNQRFLLDETQLYAQSIAPATLL